MSRPNSVMLQVNDVMSRGNSITSRGNSLASRDNLSRANSVASRAPSLGGRSDDKTSLMNGGIGHTNPNYDDEFDTRSVRSEARSLFSVRSSVSTRFNKKDPLEQLPEEPPTVKNEPTPVNERYNRTRRYDAAGKYRIGPSFITKSRLAYVDENKPAKLCVAPNPEGKSLEFGLLTYLWTFTDQHDKQEIDLAFIQSLIDSGCNINCRDEYGQTILHAIVRDWHADVAVFAIRNNADVNAQDRYGRTPLHLAAALNSFEMAKVLLINGAAIDMCTNNDQQTAMHYAAKYNSLETMKVLLKFQGSFTQRDSENRTVLFLAAEQGSTETAQFLLDIGAPVGVYDSEGNSAISHLIEKMPHVGYRALHQFVVSNMSLKRSEMYLSYLESNTKAKSGMIAKSPLEMIATYHDTDLIMHPVIQKAIQVKWNFFGKQDALKKLLITFVYCICWLVLAYHFPDGQGYYRPWSENGWKILFEALIIIFALYFFFEDVNMLQSSSQYHRSWTEWKQHTARSNYVNCHPCWPGDREKLESETERIRSVPSLTGQNRFWFFYEWVVLFLILVLIVTRALYLHFDNNLDMFLAHKFIFGVSMITSFCRLIKIGIRFRYCGVFLRVTGMAVTCFFQMLYLYIQIYIPFIVVFWLMFGGDNGLDKLEVALNSTDITKGMEHCRSHLQDLTKLSEIFFHVFESSFGQEEFFCYTVIEKELAQTLISFFHALSTFITLSILVALITSKFTTNYNLCVAEASLIQAVNLLTLEKNIGRQTKARLANYYRKCCNPLVVTYKEPTDFDHKRNALSQLRLAERKLSGIENIIRETEDRCIQNDRKNQVKILESMRETTENMNEVQENLVKQFRVTMKEIFQKQEFINRTLPKLLKSKD